MESPNLMNVPTRATRRMERYGVLALVFFLTTFGVLYLWEGEGTIATTSHAGESVAVRVPPSSRSRPERAMPSGVALTERTPRVSELPLSEVSRAQRDLAEMRDATREERARSVAQRSAESAIRRNNAARYFEQRVPESVDGDVAGAAEAPVASPVAPREKVQPLEYIVKSGDSLSMIAQRELGTVRHLQRLRDYNGLKSDFLREGQILILPHIGDVAPVQGTSLKLPQRALKEDWKMVKVEEGQSLWKIAAIHLGAGSRYTEIMAWNDLSSETVHPGRELRLKEDLLIASAR